MNELMLGLYVHVQPPGKPGGKMDSLLPTHSLIGLPVHVARPATPLFSKKISRRLFERFFEFHDSTDFSRMDFIPSGNDVPGTRFCVSQEAKYVQRRSRKELR